MFDWQWGGTGGVGMPTNYGAGFAGPTPNSYMDNVGPMPLPTDPYRSSPGFMPVQTQAMTGSPLADTTGAFAPTTGASAGDSPSGFQWSNMLNPLFLGGLGMLANSFGGRPYGSPGPMQGFMMGAGMGRQFQLDQEERERAQAEAARQAQLDELAAQQRARVEAARGAMSPEQQQYYDLFGSPMPGAEDTRTTAQKNMEAAGLVPGTPEYEKTMKDYLLKPSSSITLTPTDKLEQERNHYVELERIALGEYEGALEAARGDPTDKQKRLALEVAQEKVMLARQNLYNTGRELSARAQDKLRPPGLGEDIALDVVEQVGEALGGSAEQPTGEVSDDELDSLMVDRNGQMD